MILDILTTKEMIITSLGSQIDSLINSYEMQFNQIKDESSSLLESYKIQIEQLKEENTSLSESYKKQLKNLMTEHTSMKGSYGEQIETLENENARLSDEINHLKSKSNEYSVIKTQLKPGVKNNNLQNLIPVVNEKNTRDDIIKRLNDLPHQSSIEKYTDFLANINGMDPHGLSKTELKTLIVSLDRLIRIKTNEDLGIQFSYKLFLEVIKRFSFSEEFIGFVNRNGDLLTKRVLEIKDSKLITDLARIYFLYDNHQSLAQLLEQLIKNSSTTIDNIEKQDFIYFLWYSFYFDKDKRIPRDHKKVLTFLKDSDPVIVSYITYYEIINGRINYETGYKKIKDCFNKTISLSKSEKEKLLNSIDKRLKKFKKKNVRHSKQKSKRTKI